MASHVLSSMTGSVPLELLGQTGGSFWLPPPDSTTAGSVDGLFYFLLWLSAFFFTLIVGLMVLFVIRYRRRPGEGPKGTASHSTLLEVVWTSIPVVLVVIIFYWGFIGYIDMRLPPRDAYEINVVAQKWQWMFKYSNGHVDTDLHVPVDQPVQLVMRSKDVIHSLSIPDFRVKMDIVPGRYTKTWFNARNPGQHLLVCTEYCGTGHSDMTASVFVHKSGEFDLWLENAALFAADMSPADRGQLLWRRHGCQGCHSEDGTAKTGPSFKGIWGEEHELVRGSPVTVDEDYVRESVLDPSAKVRKGYKDQMNSYKGSLSDDEIHDLIEFIKSLRTSAAPEAEDGG